jgi:hypothetical protein
LAHWAWRASIALAEAVSARPGACAEKAGRLRRVVGLGRNRRDRRLILGSDEAALDTQCAVALDADEDAGAGDVGGIEPDRLVFERRQGGLDLAEALIDCFP